MISVVIQAGGRSSRMGQDKALVMLGDRPMIAHTLACVADLGNEILLTTNAADKLTWLGLPMFGDEQPGAGALPGLQTALRAAAGEYVLVVAVDMPFLNRDLLAYQLQIRATADIIVPVWEERHQTMHTVYHRQNTLAAVENALANGKKRMNSFYDDLVVREVTAEEIGRFDDGITFFNVNTAAQLEAAAAMLPRQSNG